MPLMARPRRSPYLKPVKLGESRPGPKPLPRASFTVGAPTMPATVEGDPVAAAHWRRLAHDLKAAGILTPAYGAALALLALGLADAERLRAVCMANPDNPAARRALDRATTITIRLLREFGLTASSAPLVKAAPPPEEPDPFSRFLSPRRRGASTRDDRTAGKGSVPLEEFPPA